MLGGFLRLRFYIEVAGEANASCIVYSQMHQASHVVQFQPHVGVQQGFIALTAAPEYIALTAQLYSGINGTLDLCSSICENVCTGRSACTVHITRVIEALCGAPQQLLAGSVLLFLAQVNDDSQLFVGFAQTAVFRREISVVEAVVVNAQLVHDLESSFYLCLCTCSDIITAPCLVGGAAAEHVCAVTAHSVPPGQCELQLFPHGLAGDNLVRIIKLECQRILGILAFISNLRNVVEKFTHQ